MILQDKTLEKLRLLINEETEYRSEPQLVNFFNDLCFNDSYGQGFPSRWLYPQLLIRKWINEFFGLILDFPPISALNSS